MKAVVIGLEVLISLSLVSMGFTFLMAKMLLTQRLVSQNLAAGSSLFSQEEEVQQAIYAVRSTNLSLYQATGVFNAAFGNGYSLRKIDPSVLQNRSYCACTERLLAIDGDIYLLKVWGNGKTTD